MSALLRFLTLVVLLFTAHTAAAQQALPDRVLGNPDAKITIYEYSSLTCPHCATFHRETLPKIRKDWIDTGKAKLVFRDFPLGGVALGASVISHCLDPNKYYGFVDTLFETQGKWAQAPNPMQALKNMARLAGMSEEKFNACLNDGELMKKIQTRADEASKKYNISSTPSFVINEKTIQGALPYEEFDSALKAAGK